MFVDFLKRLIYSITTGVSLLWAGIASAEYGLNFPEPVTPIGQSIYDVHMLTMGIVTVILVIMTAIVFYAVYTFRKDKGYEADQEFHNSWFGRWSWVIVPIAVLGIDLGIAGKAQPILEMLWESPSKECSDPTLKPEEKDKCYDMIVKIIGHQWWWEYEYPDLGIKVESRYTPEEEAGDDYLRAVDNHFVLPINKKIRFLQTSVDVNHAYWIPELGFKKDAIAGYISETWGEIKKEGIYRGQCAELCGTWHARMPAVVEAVSQEKFDSWVAEKQAQKQAAIAEATSGRVWTKDELYAKGETAYNVKCGACHQVSGLGIPPAFPALKDSKIVKGPIAEHIKIVLNGLNTMPPWSGETDLDLAAMITYERNAWGNNTNDIVQPADIKAAREQLLTK